MTDRAQLTTIDGVKALVVVRPQTRRTVVMLHGFGAGCDDLAPLAAHLDPQGAWNWVFPDGIVEVPIGPHNSGRAWFPLRIAELEAAAGGASDFAERSIDGLSLAATRIRSLIEHLRVDPTDLALGGFSQGAMVAVNTAARLATTVRGLVLFSGALVDGAALREGLVRLAGVSFYQSHGRADQVLAFAHGQRLTKCLIDAGLRGELAAFAGGHEIPYTVVSGAARYLDVAAERRDNVDARDP